MNEGDTLIAWGGEVKRTKRGKVGGYLVLFSGPSDPDLTGDFFTKETDFGPHTSTLCYYDHGFDGTLKTRPLGEGVLEVRDAGVWLEAQLQARDEYERALQGLIDQGKLGWSSGTASHLVERRSMGAAHHIDRWPLGLDASLTPTPAEPRTSVIPLKSYHPAGLHDGLTFADHSDSVLATVEEFVKRAQEIHDLRVSEGRHSSDAFRSRLAALKSQIDALTIATAQKADPKIVLALHRDLIAIQAQVMGANIQ